MVGGKANVPCRGSVMQYGSNAGLCSESGFRDVELKRSTPHTVDRYVGNADTAQSRHYCHPASTRRPESLTRYRVRHYCHTL
jgi:hypothetical protein